MSFLKIRKNRLDFNLLLATALFSQFLWLYLDTKKYLNTFSFLSLIFLTLLGIIILLSKEIKAKGYQRLKVFIQRKGLFPILGSLLTMTFLLDNLAMPSFAGIFSDMKGRVTTLFEDVGNDDLTNFIGLTFGVMEALFWIYVIWAVIRVVQAFRENEDWQNAAKTPLLIIVMIAAVNVIMGLV